MSSRHAKPRSGLHRLQFAGAISGAAAVGVTAISLMAAGPAHSSQNQFSPATRAALAFPAHTFRAPKVPLVPIPGKGIVAGLRRDAERVAPHAPTAADTLKLAQAQVGITENAQGGGTKFQQWFVASPFAKRGVARDGGSVSDYANANWCDMFVSWVGNTLGVKGMGADAFTRTHAQWFKDQGRWGSVAKPGAVVFFSWSGGGIDQIDHVGLVVKDNGNGTIQTIEGNTDDAVKERTRDKSTVVGYGYPEYAS